MTEASGRADPDALLTRVNEAEMLRGRAKLKIFLLGYLLHALLKPERF